MTSENTKTTKNRAPQAGDTAFFAMTHMLRYSAKAEDATFPVTELFFDPDQGLLRYVALDVGGWFDRREVIVAERLMGEPDNASRAWPVDISPKSVKNAPEWTDPAVMQNTSLSAMPPLMVSPFGGHFAGTAVSDELQKQDVPESEGNLKVDGFERLNDWIGLPLIGQDGDVGTLIDFLFEADTGRLTHLVIDTGGMLAAQQVVVPYDLLTGLSDDGSHATVKLTAKLIREAPPLEHFDEINRSWIDALRSYYQLAPRL
jgi:hypothetical protein